MDESERRLSVIAHASALLGLILPLGQMLGPYLTWLLAPTRSRARQQAAEAFDFQLNMVVLVLALVAALLWLRGGWWFFILFVPNLYAFGMALRAATRASRGEDTSYPTAFRVLGSSGTRAAPQHARR